MSNLNTNSPLAGSPVQPAAAAGNREPLLEQVRKETRLPQAPRKRRATRLVSDMLQREYALAEEYDKALDTNLDPSARQIARDFRADHDYQATAMREELERLGGSPASPTFGQRLRARGRVWMARLRPSKSVMGELRREELRLAHELRAAAASCGDFDKTRKALQRGSAMAEHHAAFIRDYRDGELSVQPKATVSPR